MRLGRVEATGGFFLLLAWMNYLDRQGIVPLAMLACALHELGHLAILRLEGIRPRLLRLTAVGAELLLPRPLSYRQELAAALAGPGVNLLLALLCCRWERGALFAGLNLAIGCFNLLPVGRLDGGRALRCVVALLAGPDWAERLGAGLDMCISGVLLGAGVLLAGRGGNFTLLLVAVWQLAGKSAELGLAIGRGNGYNGRQSAQRGGVARRRVQPTLRLEEEHEPHIGTHSAQGTKARPIHRRRIQRSGEG